MSNSFNYNDPFLNALNISPANSTPLGTNVSSSSPPNYNALLWKKVNTDRHMSTKNGGNDGGYAVDMGITDNGSFFTVATFSGPNHPANTNLTGNLINAYYTAGLQMDDSGNLHIDGQRDGAGNPYTWNNPLMPGSPYSASNSKNQKPTRDDMMVSSSGKWILMKDLPLSVNGNNVYYILYNPIHSKAFKNYYTKITDDTLRLSDPLLQKYAEIMANKTKNPNNGGNTKPINTDMNTVFQVFNWANINYQKYTNQPGDGSRDYADITCNLLYDRECVNYPTGGQIPFQYPQYSLLSAVCSCAAPGGRGMLFSTSDNISRDSFISNFAVDALNKKNKTTTCPQSITIYNCNTNIQSAGDTKVENSQVNVNCGVSPIDCTLSDPIWNDDCKSNDGVSATGTKTGYKTVLKDAMGSGKCSADPVTRILKITGDCTLKPVNCVPGGDWKNVGSCSATCGIGKQLQMRPPPLQKALYGGVDCGPDTRAIDCDTGIPCPNTPTTPAPVTPALTTPPTAPAPTQTPTQAPPQAPLVNNTTIMIAGGVILVSIGIYFYLSKKAAK